MVTHYEILGVEMNASYAEIKRSYHALALKCHPDKCETSDNGTLTFQEVDEAWKTLKDPIKRRAYDEHLRILELEEQQLIAGNYTLHDLDFDSETNVYSITCSCGGVYQFAKEEFEQFNSCLVGCEQCSLMITVDFQ